MTGPNFYVNCTISHSIECYIQTGSFWVTVFDRMNRKSTQSRPHFRSRSRPTLHLSADTCQYRATYIHLQGSHNYEAVLRPTRSLHSLVVKNMPTHCSLNLRIGIYMHVNDHLFGRAYAYRSLREIATTWHTYM